MRPVTQSKERAGISALPLKINYVEHLAEVEVGCGRSIFIPCGGADFLISLYSQASGDSYLNRVPLSFLCGKFPQSVCGGYFEMDLSGMGGNLALQLSDENVRPGTMEMVNAMWQVRGLR